MQLWIVGLAHTYSGMPFSFEGVFDSIEKATERCFSPQHWIWPVELNQEMPDELVDWPGAYYPAFYASCMEWPRTWPRYRNGACEPCDVVIGPCSCGASHSYGEFFYEVDEKVLYRYGEEVVSGGAA